MNVEDTSKQISEDFDSSLLLKSDSEGQESTPVKIHFSRSVSDEKRITLKTKQWTKTGILHTENILQFKCNSLIPDQESYEGGNRFQSFLIRETQRNEEDRNRNLKSFTTQYSWASLKYTRNVLQSMNVTSEKMRIMQSYTFDI